MDLYPLTFAPIYKEKIWGGRSLERLFGRHLPAGKSIGESWDLADLPEGASVVAEGPLAGTSLTELTASAGRELLGAAQPMDNGGFPLLLKLLDANDTLSLQVHPDAQAVAAIGPEAALKTECWLVLESRGGYIYKGVRPGVTPESFRRAIENNTVQTQVQRIDVAAGQFYYLPAGTVHAMGAGVVVAEVQTPSDTTYRVTDWGRGRDLHVERSLQCIHFVPETGPAPGASGETLLVTDFFTVQRKTVAAGETMLVSESQCTALMLLKAGGPVRLSWGGGAATARVGQTILLPAALAEVRVTAGAGCSFLRITLPEESWARN